MMTENHVLYRFYDAAGLLLYVGITCNPPQRFREHRDSKDWWTEVERVTLQHYRNRENLARAERRAIRDEHPLHNIIHNDGAVEPITGLLDSSEIGKLAAVESGVNKAFWDFINNNRDISTLHAIEYGTETAMTTWLEKHADAIIDAIAQQGGDRG